MTGALITLAVAAGYAAVTFWTAAHVRWTRWTTPLAVARLLLLGTVIGLAAHGIVTDPARDSLLKVAAVLLVAGSTVAGGNLRERRIAEHDRFTRACVIDEEQAITRAHHILRGEA